MADQQSQMEFDKWLRVCTHTHTHTHTHSNQQLSSRSWFKISVATLRLFVAMILVTSLITLTSCSSITEPEVTVTQSSPKNHDNDGSDKSNHSIADWTDAGVLHNAFIHAADDSLSINWHNRFTTEAEYLEWLFDDCLSGTALILGISSEDEESARENFWLTDPEDLVLSGPELDELLYDLVEEETISQRESNFMKRHHNIVHLCYGVTLMSAIEDSMDDWKNDIIAITWDEDETTIIPLMSVAYQSFYFWLEEGYDDTDEDIYDGPVILRNDANAAEIDKAAIEWAIHHFGWTFPEDEDRILNYAAYCSANRGFAAALLDDF